MVDYIWIDFPKQITLVDRIVCLPLYREYHKEDICNQFHLLIATLCEITSRKNNATELPAMNHNAADYSKSRPCGYSNDIYFTTKTNIQFIS